MILTKRYRMPIVLAIIKFTLPFLMQDTLYELHRDEYLYLAEARHMAWGFLEVPPLLSLFATITHLMGNGFFWVKFWPSLFGALTVLIICEMVSEMKGRIFAQFLASTGFIAGIYLRVHFLFQPNFLEIFWWSLLALLMLKYINTQNNRYIVSSGLAIGIAWLSKYSIVFFVIGMLVGLVLTSNRKLLLQKHLYWAVLAAGLIALPNILWQYNHQWPVFYHMKELRETQLQFIPPSDFLKDQLLMHLPFSFIWIGGLIWLLFSPAGKHYRILGWIYLTVIALLIVTSGKNYYSLGAYPMVYAAGAVWFEKITRVKLKIFRPVSLAIITLLFIPIIPVLLPVWKPVELETYYKKFGFDKIGVTKWEDLKVHALPQDFADMLGWKEMARITSKIYAALPDSVKSSTMIHCRNYGQAGAISYYGDKLPQVNTDNASFLLWMPEKYQVKNILLIARHLPEKDDIVFQQFERVRLIDSVNNPFSREFGTKIFLFENGNEKVNSLIEIDVREQKKRFVR